MNILCSKFQVQVDSTGTSVPSGNSPIALNGNCILSIPSFIILKSLWGFPESSGFRLHGSTARGWVRLVGNQVPLLHVAWKRKRNCLQVTWCKVGHEPVKLVKRLCLFTSCTIARVLAKSPLWFSFFSTISPHLQTQVLKSCLSQTALDAIMHHNIYRR